MKTLKKTLAVILALAMVLGMAVSASAATFSDDAKITDKEAVEVMNTVGVFIGSNGAFDPQGNLTREQAAKIVAYLMLGEEAAEALPAVKVFDDVDATRWSAKYVAYCAAKGIVAGVGNNKFEPTENVTDYEFGKMMLCCLGYDATIEGFVGSNWSINVSQMMSKNDLADKVGTPAGKALNREQAARYALNTLKATMVEYESKGTEITVNGATIATGASKASAVKSKANYADAFGDSADADGYWTVELGESLYDGDLEYVAGEADDMSRPGHAWTWKNTTELGSYANSAKFTYTAKVKAEDVKKDLKNYTVLGTGTDIDTFVADVVAASGNGITIEIFANSDKEITAAICIEPKFVEVTAVTEKAETKSHGAYTEYTIDGAKYKVFSTVVDEDEDIDTAILNGTFKKGDFVTYYKTTNSTPVKVYVDPVTSVSGVLSNISSKGVYTIDGTGYKLSAVDGAEAPAISTKSQDFYLDKFGYVIKSYTEAETNYAYVVSAAEKFTKTEDETLEQKWYATLVLADGTVETVCTDTVDYSALAQSIVTYTSDDDDIYTLTAADAARLGIATSIDNTTKEIDGLYANAKTVYYALTYKEVKGTPKFQNAVTEVVGYTKVASYDGGSDNIVFALDSSKTADGIADIVFIDTTADALETGKYVYACKTWNSTKDGSYKWDVIIAGEADTVTLNASQKALVKAGKLYADVADLKAGTPATLATSTDLKNNGGVVILGGAIQKNGSKAVVFADDAKIYSIDTEEDEVVVLTADDIATKIEGDIFLEFNSDNSKVVAAYVLWSSK